MANFEAFCIVFLKGSITQFIKHKSLISEECNVNDGNTNVSKIESDRHRIAHSVTKAYDAQNGLKLPVNFPEKV